MDDYPLKYLFLHFISLLLAASLLVGCDAGLSSQEHFNKAVELHKKGELHAAVIHFKKVLQAEPENTAARMALAKAYLDIGDGLSAEKELRFAQANGVEGTELSLAQALLLQKEYDKVVGLLKSNVGLQNSPLWQNALGEALLGKHDVAGAEERFQASLAFDDNNIDALQGLAKVAIARNSSDIAEQYLETALRQDADNSQTWLMKGDIAFANGEMDDAELYYSRSLKLKDGVGTRVKLARLLLAQNKPDRAKQYIDVLKRDFPNNIVTNYLEAVYVYQKEDLPAAKGIFQKVIAAKANHVPSLFLLGKISYQLKEYEQAQYILSKLVSIAPDHLEARKLLAISQINLRLPKDAISTLLSAESRVSGDHQYYLILANAYFADGQMAKGEDYLRKAVDAAPESESIALRTKLAAVSASRDIDEGIEELESVIKSDLGNYQAELMLGILYLKKEDFDKALRVAQKLLEKHGENPLFYNLAAGAYEGKKLIGEARASYDKTLALDPANITANLNQARLDLLLKDGKSAREYFEAVLKHDPDNEQALMGLALIVGNEGESEAAIDLLDRARVSNPSSLKVRLLLAEIYLRMKNYKDAIRIAEEAVSLAPRSEQAVMIQGQSQMLGGKYGDSVRSFKRLLGLTSKLPETYFLLSKAQVANKEFDDAKVSLRKVLELNDQQLILPANMALANVELVLGNADQAERIARQIKKGYPESSNGFMLQGDVLMSKNMAKDAVEAYKLALSKSQDGVVINKLYEAYNASGETEKGLELLRNWLNSNPEDLSTRVSYAQALQKGGKTAQAISEFGEVVRMDPNNLLALNNLSMLYLRNNDRKYLDTSRKAYQLAPDNPAIIDTYGWALVKSGSLEQGLALIERAATESRDDYDIRYHLAAALAERGNIARARTELEKIISDNRQFAEKKAASDLLKEIQK